MLFSFCAVNIKIFHTVGLLEVVLLHIFIALHLLVWKLISHSSVHSTIYMEGHMILWLWDGTRDIRLLIALYVTWFGGCWICSTKRMSSKTVPRGHTRVNGDGWRLDSMKERTLATGCRVRIGCSPTCWKTWLYITRSNHFHVIHVKVAVTLLEDWTHVGFCPVTWINITS